MDDVTNQSIEGFLSATAERVPTPGGGAVAALVGALGASLSRMVAAYSVGARTTPEARGDVETHAIRLHRADQLLRALITQDAAAYKAMTAARTKAKVDDKHRPAYQQAVLAAIAVPMEIAGVASDALAAMDEMKSIANRHLLSDLAAAAMIAHAAVQASRCMALVNLPDLDDEALRLRLKNEIDHTVSHGHDREASIERFVHEALEFA